MDNPFFVMLKNQAGDYAEPIVNGDGEVQFYPTAKAARYAMRGHVYAEAFGFEIFQMGEGE